MQFEPRHDRAKPVLLAVGPPSPPHRRRAAIFASAAAIDRLVHHSIILELNLSELPQGAGQADRTDDRRLSASWLCFAEQRLGERRARAGARESAENRRDDIE